MKQKVIHTYRVDPLIGQTFTLEATSKGQAFAKARKLVFGEFELWRETPWHLPDPQAHTYKRNRKKVEDATGIL